MADYCLCLWFPLARECDPATEDIILEPRTWRNEAATDAEARPSLLPSFDGTMHTQEKNSNCYYYAAVNPESCNVSVPRQICSLVHYCNGTIIRVKSLRLDRPRALGATLSLLFC